MLRVGRGGSGQVGGPLTGSLRAHSQSLFLVQALPTPNCTSVALCSLCCLLSVEGLRFSPPLAPSRYLLPCPSCLMGSVHFFCSPEEPFPHLCLPYCCPMLKPNTNLLLEANSWPDGFHLLSLHCFHCVGAVLAGKLTGYLSFSHTHCGLWVPTASGTGWPLGD